MKGHIGTILKKELCKFFSDKRTALSTILLPGIMIFVMYSFMGTAITSQFSVDEDYKTKCYVHNMPASLNDVFKEANLEVKNVKAEEREKIKDKISNKKADVLVSFSDNFDNDVAAYDATKADKAPGVDVFYNSAEKTSSQAYTIVTDMLSAYESTMTNKFDVNAGEEIKYDLASEEDTTANFFAGMLPMLLLIFIFSGVMGIAPDSIAGEKERGTISTLLVTPVNRSHIAIGKILAVSIIAILSATSSTIGTVASFPKLLGAAEDTMSGNVYGIKEYAYLMFVIITTVLVVVALLGMVSAFAKSIKEAQTYCTPVMIVVALIGVTAMFGADAKSENVYYFVPLYNCVQSMVSIFKLNIVPVHIVITCLSNLVYTGIGIFAMTKMFHSEKVMFSK